MLAELAADSTLPESEHAEELASSGFASAQLDTRRTESIRRALNFKGSAGNRSSGNAQAHPHWVGLPRRTRVRARVARFDAHTCRELHGLLWADDVTAVLQAGSAKQLTITAARGLQPQEPAAVGATQRLGTPPGGRRAMLVLAGRLGIGLTEPRQGGEPAEMTLEPGALLVFDPQRVRLQCTSMSEEVEVLELTLIPRTAEQPARVLSMGWNDWPCDPFHVPLTDHACHPPVAGKVLHLWADVPDVTL